MLLSTPVQRVVQHFAAAYLVVDGWREVGCSRESADCEKFQRRSSER